jgi:hypothetical protein
MDVGLVAGVVALGVVHGVLPDHGWPIAAVYALDRPRKWVSGAVTALVLGVGHLVSSVAPVLAYYRLSTFATFAEGPRMKPLASVLLGIYEYASGHEHGRNTVGCNYVQILAPPVWRESRTTYSRQYKHDHGHFDDRYAEEGLRTLGATALLLGVTHEEPIQIL